ncbi:Fc receptor-like protein 5 isoform X2 [Hypomesus transpacificus]|uniref:Fc receptor-like protein 5 isoform X2 n=1 Tax=Hypomesus transpacificus TaxID=137520 RepID=UPI001F083605|nr:Fc receptor-like protein 5 isoform X2 [Hypomesus transpacificus]
MEFTPLCFMLLLMIPSECAKTAVSLSPTVSLSVSPSRSQFFKYESVSLSCEDQGSSAGGRVRRNTTKRWLEECPADWGVATAGSPCSIQDTFPHDSGVYWCESGSGEHSHAVNITVHGGAVILESPVLPVNQGQAVTLRCRYQTPPSNLTAAFYKDGSLVRTEAAGEMTIPAVSTSDAGLYRCSNSELGGSPDCWLAVRARLLLHPSSTTTSPASPPAPLLSLPRLLCGILVSLPYLVVTILLLERCCRSKGVCSEAKCDKEEL